MNRKYGTIEILLFTIGILLFTISKTFRISEPAEKSTLVIIAFTIVNKYDYIHKNVAQTERKFSNHK